MENVELLVNRNGNVRPTQRNSLTKGRAVFRMGYERLYCLQISQMLTYIKEMRKRMRSVNVPVILDVGDIQATDKLCIILLECMLYAFLKQGVKMISLNIGIRKTIVTEYIHWSPLLRFLAGNACNTKGFMDYFE